MPARICSANTSPTRWPHGSSETIFFGSAHCGHGPISVAGEVSVRSGRWSARQRPRRHRQRAVDRVGAAVGADRVAVARRRPGWRRPGRAARRARRAPAQRHRAAAGRSGMGGQPNVPRNRRAPCPDSRKTLPHGDRNRGYTSPQLGRQAAREAGNEVERRAQNFIPSGAMLPSTAAAMVLGAGLQQDDGHGRGAGNRRLRGWIRASSRTRC